MAVNPDKVEAGRQDYDRYIGMFPILKFEIQNANYVYEVITGKSVDPDDFDKLIFKEGKRPERPKPLLKPKKKPVVEDEP